MMKRPMLVHDLKRLILINNILGILCVIGFGLAGLDQWQWFLAMIAAGLGFWTTNSVLQSLDYCAKCLEELTELHKPT